jgi:hypothetical protein
MTAGYSNLTYLVSWITGDVDFAESPLVRLPRKSGDTVTLCTDLDMSQR